MVFQDVHGFGDKEHCGLSRGFRIGVGALEVVLGILIIISPGFGASLVGIIIAIAVHIVRIQMVVVEISGNYNLWTAMIKSKQRPSIHPTL
jgi:uncharacterized membrane protein HdeD (DUF308 family)